jgi:hypothetical protein
MHLEAARSIQHKRKAAEEQRQKAAEEQRQKAAEEQRQKAAEEQRQKAAEQQRQKAADEKKEKEEMEKKQKENASFQQREKESQDSVRDAGGPSLREDNVRRGLFREPSFQEPTSAAQPIQNTIHNRIVPTNKSLSPTAILMNLEDSDESSQPLSTHSDSFTSSPSSNRSSQLSNGILQSEKNYRLFTLIFVID